MAMKGAIDSNLRESRRGEHRVAKVEKKSKSYVRMVLYFVKFLKDNTSLDKKLDLCVCAGLVPCLAKAT